MLEKREFDNDEFLYRLATAITVVAGLFSLIVFSLLAVNYLQIRRADPVNHKLLVTMRQEYAATPTKDEALAQRIQTLDLLTRKAFFTSQNHLRIGGMLLLVGTCTFLISFKYMLRWKREKPRLADMPTHEREFLAFAKSRQLITWGGVGILAVGLLSTVMTQSLLARQVSGETTPLVAAATEDGAVPAAAFVAPDWETMQKNWPSFRGPGSNGVAFYTTAPTSWDVEAGAGVKWKTTLSAAASNSPVVWDNKIFMSAADDQKRDVYCYDAETGAEIWKKTLDRFPNTPESPAVSEETGHAAPTMAAHGNLVFAIFANGDLAALDSDGNPRWGYNVGLPDNHYGHSSSLVAYGNLLYVQIDHNSAQKVMAVEAGTGKEVWSTPRHSISWASPIVAQTTFGPQLMLCSETSVDAYAPDTGKLLWTQDCLSGEVAPSPAYSNGLVFVANEFAVATAIELAAGEGEGAVTPKMLWEYDEYLPEVASPVGDGERFYFATSVGELVCLNAKTGEEHWVHEVNDGFYSSPIIVGDRIYVLDMGGNMHIMRAAATAEVIATIAMGEETFATPAFMDGRIYIRTPEHLYCIEHATS